MDFLRRFLELLVKFFAKEPASPKAPTESPPIAGDDSSYRKLFDSMAIRPNWAAQASSAADLILRGRARYQSIEKETGVPWYMIGVIHNLEGSCSFKTHLHNGDSLSKRTTHVPAGRPLKGSPPFSWEESAVDALAYDKIRAPLETIGQQFKALESFNGMGYRYKGLNTPYLWSGSNHYSRGKYVADGRYDATAVSQQVGAACIYKIFQQRGIIKV